jgi:hypothetical protein
MTGSRFSLGRLLASDRFRRSARKAENGFVEGRIVSSAWGDETIEIEISISTMG